MLSLRLATELEKRLAALARKSGRSKASIAREAILRHIEDLEECHVAMTRLHKGGSRVSLEALEKEFL